MSKQNQEGDPTNSASNSGGSKQFPSDKKFYNIAASNIDSSVSNSNTAASKDFDKSKQATSNKKHDVALNLNKKSSIKKLAANRKLDNDAAVRINDNMTDGTTTLDDFYEPWQEWISDICSCKTCDSYNCFAIRHHSGMGCTCKSCDRVESCNFYNKLMNNLALDSNIAEKADKEHPPRVSIGKIEENIIMKPSSKASITSTCSSAALGPCRNCKPLVPLDDYELHKRQSIDSLRRNSQILTQYVHKEAKKDKPIPTTPTNENDHIYALVREYVRRELQEMSVSLRSAIEEVEKVNAIKKESKPPSTSDASTSFSTGFLNMIKSLLGINCQSCKTQTNEVDTKTETDNNADCIKTTNADQKNYSEIVEAVEKQLLEIEVEGTPSISINLGTSAAKLKAEVMSVPFTEYQQSVPRIKRPIITKLDLFERIKEIYKACSCKVCQCIGVYSEQALSIPDPRKCDCKPCECDECRHLKKIELIQPTESTLLKKHPNKCNCNMCNCIKCGDSFAISCSCKSCECVQCASKYPSMGLWKFNKRYVIATAEERPACVCSPCGCNDCGLVGFDPSNIRSRQMHDMGTDERRHINCNCDSCSNDNCEQEGADTCVCSRHTKLMRKPVVKDTNEYDIRFALDCIKPKRDTLTMFASVPNRLNTSDYRNRRVASEDGTQYELQDVNASSDASEFWPEHHRVIIKQIQGPCDCEPCECIKCQKHFLEGHIANKRNAQNCSCEICDCITSADLGVSYTEKKFKYLEVTNSSTNICECVPCDCIDCRKYIRTKMHEQFQKQVTEPNPYIEDEPSSSVKVTDDSDDYVALLKNDPDPNYFIDLILTDKESKNCMNRQERSFQPDTFKIHSAVLQKNIVNYSKTHVGRSAILKPLQLNPVRENLVSKIKNMTGNDDSENISATVLRFDECSSIGHKNESSYDSSAHEYLHPCPSTTVATCIHDVMNLDGFDISKIRSLKSGVKIKSVDATSKYSNLISTETMQNISHLNNNKARNKKSINWCNPYGSSIADHAKYTYELPKLDTCCHCDCSGCSCDHIPCLDLGDKMYIRKHETTQTTECQDNKILPLPIKDSDRITSFIMSVQENRHLEFRPSLKKLNMSFNYADKNKSFKRTTLPISQSQPKKSSDYSNIKRTLQESKQLSIELLHKLQKYEQANKEFESILAKYKKILSHDEISSEEGSKKELNKIIEESSTTELETKSNLFNIPSNINKKSPHTSMKKIALFEKLEEYEQSNKKIKEMTAKYRQMQESAPDNKINLKIAQQKETDIKEKSEAAENQMKDTTSSTHVVDNKDENSPLTIMSKTGDDLCYENNKTPLDYKNELSIDKQNVSLMNKEGEEQQDSPQKILKQQFIDFSKMINTAILRCEKQVWVENTNKSILQEVKYGNVPTEDTDTLNTNEAKKKDEHIVTSLGKVEEMESGMNENGLEQKPPGQESNDCLSEEEKTPTAKYAPLFGNNTSSPAINQEVKHVLSAGAASSIATNYKKRDTKKVNIRTLRRVSKHTILMDWKVPGDLTNVSGYEVMVDGRTVQKVRTPLRNLAIITGLPSSKRVLLTIRTLLNDSVTGNRMPCATCVYNSIH